MQLQRGTYIAAGHVHQTEVGTWTGIDTVRQGQHMRSTIMIQAVVR
jgi:hypothetical protein